MIPPPDCTAPGNVFPLQPKVRELSREEAKALVHAAFACERRIKEGIAQIQDDTWALAEHLYEWHRERYWEVVGFETLEAFLAQPEIEMSPRSFFRLVQVWRDLHVTKQLPPVALRQIEVSKAAVILPAVMSGKVKPEKALDDAKALPRRALEQKYRQDGVGNTQTPNPSTEGLKTAENRSEDVTCTSALRPGDRVCMADGSATGKVIKVTVDVLFDSGAKSKVRGDELTLIDGEAT